MPTDLENLQTARSSLITKIAAVYASPKADYSIDGQSVSHSAYAAMLTQRLAELDDLIARESGPYEHKTQAIL